MNDMEKQVETRMIEDITGKYCICLDKNHPFNGWLFDKNPDGQWVSHRLALPREIEQAQEKFKELSQTLDMPHKE